MKLVKQSYELLGTPQSLEEAWSFVARAARNCYQSEKTRLDESEEDFCKRILLKHPEDLEKDHMSPFEFGVVYLKRQLSTKDKEDKRWASKYMLNPYSRYKSNLIECDYVPLDKQVIGQPIDGIWEIYITTNLRVILENHWEDDLKYAGPPTKYHMKACCFKFDTSIHVYKDLTRHEGALSFAIESTRYCKYSSPKFGSGLTFIWHPRLAKYSAEELHLDKDGIFNEEYDGLPFEADILFHGFVEDEYTYMTLINQCGWTAQDAATKLPQDTKATVFMCGYEDNLQHMFRLRAEECSGPVLPQVAEITKPMYESYKQWLENA